MTTLRVDIVGSFLRPAGLKDAFRRHSAGELDDAGLHDAQDAAIRQLVHAEEAHGLPIVGDGEFKRTSKRPGLRATSATSSVFQSRAHFG
jgi:5-methyltetrahydropteroyltriglutamate--homocysteine methyltransferase